MGRPFEQRSDYDEEVVLLQRLVRLFRADKMLPETARGKIVENLRETLSLLATEEKPETLPIEDRLLKTRKKVVCPECGGSHSASECDAEEPDQAVMVPRRRRGA